MALASNLYSKNYLDSSNFAQTTVPHGFFFVWTLEPLMSGQRPGFKFVKAVRTELAAMRVGLQTNRTDRNKGSTELSSSWGPIAIRWCEAERQILIQLLQKCSTIG